MAGVTEVPAAGDAARDERVGLADGRLPPGQYVARNWPVLHYGPVPKFREELWDFRVFGATATGEDRWFGYRELLAFGRLEVRADFHCVTKYTLLDNVWSGVPTRAVLRAVPPAPDVTHVMVWAEYGYSANLRLEDFGAATSILADSRNGERLTADHGYPLRLVVPHLYAWKGPKWVRGLEYLTVDRRGFWEERGYHNVADPWHEQRYSYQELPGEGPPPDAVTQE
jgi:DMSO/TMAO reductase YedYZ molybdopterin-dependent catalytic subunit